MVFAVFDERHAQLCALPVKAERPDAVGLVRIHKRPVLVKIAAQDRDLRLGGVVLVLHAGRARDLAVLELFKDGRADEDLLAQNGLHLLLRDVAGAQEHRVLPRHGDDGGLDTDIGLAAVENQRQTAIHIGQRVRRIRRAGLAGKVCRRRGKRDAAGLDDLLHYRVGRHPHADGVKARAGHVADLGTAGHDHRQRAGPEGGSQLFGALGHLGDDAVHAQ